MASGSPRRVTAPLVVSFLALVVALSATPVGQSVAAGLSKGTVKKLATKVADQQIAAKASSLSVGHAATADHATTAGTATSAGSATTAGTATNADQLGGSPASAYAQKGTFEVSLNPVGWVAGQPSTSVAHFANGTQLTESTTGTRTYYMSLPMPVAANGKGLRLTRLRYCYDTPAGIVINHETVSDFQYNDGTGDVGPVPINQSVSHSINGCSILKMDLAVGPYDAVTFAVQVSFGVAGFLNLGAVSLQLEQSDTAAVTLP